VDNAIETCLGSLGIGTCMKKKFNCCKAEANSFTSHWFVTELTGLMIKVLFQSTNFFKFVLKFL
jgi:hypothetical protein